VEASRLAIAPTRRQIEDTCADYDKEKLQERVARLCGRLPAGVPGACPGCVGACLQANPAL